MAKNLKLNIKNTQIAKAVSLGGLKAKLAKKSKKSEDSEKSKPAPSTKAKGSKPKKEKVETVEDAVKTEGEELQEAPPRRVKARSCSAFNQDKSQESQEPVASPEPEEEVRQTEAVVEEAPIVEDTAPEPVVEKEVIPDPEPEVAPQPEPEPVKEAPVEKPKRAPVTPHARAEPKLKVAAKKAPMPLSGKPKVRLGPTGRHINDILPDRYKKGDKAAANKQEADAKPKAKAKEATSSNDSQSAQQDAKGKKGAKGKFRDFRDVKMSRRQPGARSFDGRDRQGLRAHEDEHNRWRKKRNKQARPVQESITVRPTELSVRLPITVKDLAAEMKLKASQLVSKLFMQGVVLTLNDFLDDDTTIQLLGDEFGCKITIDTSEEERIRITDKTIQEEIGEGNDDDLQLRAPVVTFMGHVDHGKTSLIDAIRKSNQVSTEAGAITQHIGAFRCETAVGDITILDTPGHEAFSAMRARGADVTDMCVLVVAGDEGIRQQTLEAVQHARAANVTIVVAINKCDKPNFDPEKVYRQLADNELLPEAWGGQTITVNCSAVSGEGVQGLLEMLALQAEVLELGAHPGMRARGTVLESQMHKGLGIVATILVQNGTLRPGDAVVFDKYWGRVKTMRDEHGTDLKEAGPSVPVEVTGLSGLPEAGQEFIVVDSEKEARDIAEARMAGQREVSWQQKRKLSLENLMTEGPAEEKETLNLVLRADKQGSLEALKSILGKVESKKVETNVVLAGVGEVSESDVQLAAASGAVIVGFHTQLESHAEQLVKELGVQVRLHDVIYKAADEVTALMAGLLKQVVEHHDRGKAEVRAVFKSSQLGLIAGCYVTEGKIHRNFKLRVKRGGEEVFVGSISSLKRVKDDVKEVSKGVECGILINGFNGVKEGDILEAYEEVYVSQEL